MSLHKSDVADFSQEVSEQVLSCNADVFRWVGQILSMNRNA